MLMEAFFTISNREALVSERRCERKVLTAGCDGGAGLAQSSGVRACLSALRLIELQQRGKEAKCKTAHHG